VLEGSVRKGGNRVRVTAQMNRCDLRRPYLGERYDRDLSDIFAVQDEITASVAGVIEPALAEAEQQRVLRKPPERLDAWEAYQRGLWHFKQIRAGGKPDAQTFFRQAIAPIRISLPAITDTRWLLQWEIWHFSMRPSRRFKEYRSKKRALRLRSTTGMRRRTPSWRI